MIIISFILFIIVAFLFLRIDDGSDIEDTGWLIVMTFLFIFYTSWGIITGVF